jgi:dienelactone hydrolase
VRPCLLFVAGAALLAAGTPTDEFPVVRTQGYSTQQATAAIVPAAPAPVVIAVAAPPSSDGLVVKWVSVSAPGVGAMLAAIATPAGRPPFSSVLLLHGTHGFAREYVELAVELSRGGVLAVAACWFSGGSGEGTRFIAPIACTDAPPVTPAASDRSRRTVDVLLQAVRHLPDARPDRAAVFGHSRGGGAALNYALTGGAVSALVLDSTGYPGELVQQVPRLHAPVLMLHGLRDSPADGGSAVTDPKMARSFELLFEVQARPLRPSSTRTALTTGSSRVGRNARMNSD